jgi:hypothetical protein
MMVDKCLSAANVAGTFFRVAPEFDVVGYYR